MGENKQTIEEKKIQCPLSSCKQKFLTEQDFMIHFTKAHTNSKDNDTTKIDEKNDKKNESNEKIIATGNEVFIKDHLKANEDPLAFETNDTNTEEPESIGLDSDSENEDEN